MSADGPLVRRRIEAGAVHAERREGSSQHARPRTSLLLEGPIARTLLQLAAPNVVVMIVQASLIGLAAALFPRAWLTLFDTDPLMLEAGARYLQTVGPAYGFFGLGMALYFSSQGAGRLTWPLLANLARLTLAAGGGWMILQAGGGVGGVYLAQGAGLAAFGLIIAGAIARGAWGTKLVWPGYVPRA